MTDWHDGLDDILADDGPRYLDELETRNRAYMTLTLRDDMALVELDYEAIDAWVQSCASDWDVEAVA